MDEEQRLLFQEQILLDELKIVKRKLEFIRLCRIEQKVSSEPSLATKEKEVKDSMSPSQKVTTVPSLEIKETEAIPEKPASGKEKSNPEMAMNLPKVQTEVQTSTTLVKPSDFNLRPNGGIPIPKTNVILASEKSVQEIQTPTGFNKPYYVVFNGPNPGIYESWEITKQATEGVSGIKHKKYKNFLEARIAGDQFRREQLLPPLELICSAETLKPASYAKAVEKNKNDKFKSLGKLPSKDPILLQKEDPQDLSTSGFEYLYSIARNTSEDESMQEHYFTTDNKNLSYFNFLVNANPEMVYEAFQYGLVKTIYPSQNLQEIKYFPIEIRRSVKQYRTKCVKGEKDIFLKVNSTIPVWEQGTLTRSAKHLIEIGIVSGVKYALGKRMDSSLEEKDLPELYNRKLLSFVQKSFNFHKDDKIFVNFVNKNYFIYSKGFRPIRDEDIQKILFFQESIITDSRSAHNNAICKTLIKVAPHLYNCYECEKKDKKETCKENDSPTTSTSTSSAM